MLYAIYACENVYGGLHGMDNHAIVNCTNEGEANDIGLEMSFDVMESYECITNVLEEEASEEYERDTHEWCDYLEQLKGENSYYIIYPIVDTKGKSTRKLEKEFWNNREEFVKTYCQK